MKKIQIIGPSVRLDGSGKTTLANTSEKLPRTLEAALTTICNERNVDPKAVRGTRYTEFFNTALARWPHLAGALPNRKARSKIRPLREMRFA